jgi:spore germination protein YaaH
MTKSMGAFDAIIATNEYYLQAQSPKRRFYVYNQSGTYKDVFSIDNIQTGRRYHLVGSYNGSNVSLYVDGVLQ